MGRIPGTRYDTRHGVFILFSLETYNLYSIASQLKRLFDPTTFGISLPGQVGTIHCENEQILKVLLELFLDKTFLC